MPTWFEDVERGLDDLHGIASLSEIYKKLREIRPEPHPASFDAIIRREIEIHSSDSDSYLQGKEDSFYSVEGLGAGVWGLRKYLKKTPVAVDADFATGTELPQRVLQDVYRILRDTKLARQIKALHQDRCQLCGYRIEIDQDSAYSEAHHIRPLGSPHNGPDIPGNIIVLCPNHHALLDYGAIDLKASSVSTHARHAISEIFIAYHNEKIFRRGNS